MTDTTLDGEITDEEEDGREPCPICGFRAKNLGAHMKKHNARDQANGNGRSRTTMRADARTGTIDFVEEENRLVESLSTLGTGLSMFAPYTGITIMSRAADRRFEIPGQLDANGKPRVVVAKGTASVIMDYAKKDPRIMRGVVRFNNLLHGGDLVNLALQHTAAIAVDVKAITPDFTLPIPGEPQPVMMLIPDVVEEVRARIERVEEMMREAPVEAGAEA